MIRAEEEFLIVDDGMDPRVGVALLNDEFCRIGSNCTTGAKPGGMVIVVVNVSL